ncbi:hypothetical protein [Pseudonocardia sp. ICBG162]|uniref:hypothetical protein n=1 Tax=Pseudonocardia sp. ICBG162 TaxID=2846761 RepID=UPI001CF634C8|nr:hypothetical protein [Pseudonocardia sp. ICBG162]
MSKVRVTRIDGPHAGIHVLSDEHELVERFAVPQSEFGNPLLSHQLAGVDSAVLREIYSLVAEEGEKRYRYAVHEMSGGRSE